MKPEADALDTTLPAPAEAPEQPAARAPEQPACGPELGRTATLAGAPAAPCAPGLAAGQQLGHFRIERRLGAGGMGEVYLATDLALDRPVAIKVLPEALARDPDRRDRLIREARAQARVSHPNVGHMYFIGEDAGRLYFAMEYVAGETLAERTATGPMPVDDALAMIRAAALGLREAQRSGFTHRDVKPSNLMVDGHGVLKVLDFGLVSGAPGIAGDDPVAQSSLAGTPLYMAPEQARGEPVDLRTDIYALGVTLFQLVSGRPPFAADSVEELITMHSTAARPALPRRGQPRAQLRAIDALCARMMASRPEDRFASYDDLLRAVELASLAHTRPAGFWARGIATGLDFVLVSLVVTLGLELVDSLGGPEVHGNELMLVFPIVLGYAALTVARWGKTIGKAIFELEVVDIDTSARPGLARATRRAIAIFGLPTLAIWAITSFEAAGIDLARSVSNVVMAVAIVAGVALLLHASIRASGKRTPWDRWSNTMVRYRTTRPATTL